MSKPKIILGIETSCDETAAAILQKDGDRIQILSNIVASSADLQAKYGGIIPEQAAREQIKSIIPVIKESLTVSHITYHDLDAIAITQGPGLIGSLLVGVETAKVLSTIWQKPLIPVNHLMGHFYANFIEIESRVKSQESRKKQKVWSCRGDSDEGLPPPARSDEVRSEDSSGSFARSANGSPVDSQTSLAGPQETYNNLSVSKQVSGAADRSNLPKFPYIGLLVSGGHTDLILMKSHHDYTYLGGTRDDAAGECFDKCARLLGLGYPGGPEISRLAQKGNPKAFNLPRPMIDSDDFDFSFSGLKTAVANLVHSSQFTVHSKKAKDSTNHELITNNQLINLCASIEQAIIDPLIKKTIAAAQKYKVEQIIVAGGVAANQKLVSDLKFRIQNSECRIRLSIPPPELCTDNAAMIASRAFFEKSIANPLKLQANPNLALSD